MSVKVHFELHFSWTSTVPVWGKWNPIWDHNVGCKGRVVLFVFSFWRSEEEALNCQIAKMMLTFNVMGIQTATKAHMDILESWETYLLSVKLMCSMWGTNTGRIKFPCLYRGYMRYPTWLCWWTTIHPNIFGTFLSFPSISITSQISVYTNKIWFDLFVLKKWSHGGLSTFYNVCSVLEPDQEPRKTSKYHLMLLTSWYIITPCQAYDWFLRLTKFKIHPLSSLLAILICGLQNTNKNHHHPQCWLSISVMVS